MITPRNRVWEKFAVGQLCTEYIVGQKPAVGTTSAVRNPRGPRPDRRWELFGGNTRRVQFVDGNMRQATGLPRILTVESGVSWSPGCASYHPVTLLIGYLGPIWISHSAQSTFEKRPCGLIAASPGNQETTQGRKNFQSADTLSFSNSIAHCRIGH